MKAIKFGLLILILGSATACGQQSYREDGDVSYVPGAQTDTDTTDTDTSTDSSSGSQTAGKNYVFTPKIYGNTNRGSSQTVSIVTDNILKVKVSAGALQFMPKAMTPSDGDPSTNSNWGYNVGYNCLRVAITVLDETLYAFVARSGVNTTTQTDAYGISNPCYGAKSSETLDFSPRLSSGSGSVDIKVSEVQYDNCRKAGAGGEGRGGCPMEPVYDVISTLNGTTYRYYHVVQTKLEVTGNTLN